MCSSLPPRAGQGTKSAPERPASVGLAETRPAPPARPCGDAAALLAKALVRANLHIFKTARSQAGCKGIQSSLGALWFQKRRLTVARAGTVMPYRFRDGELTSLLDESKSAHVAQALGHTVELEPAVTSWSVDAGDWFLLCSDGIVQ